MRIAREIAGTMSRMFGAETGWNQDFDLLSSEFGTRVPEDLFTLNVREHDASLLVDDKHRVRSGV
jgi:hypothetical protein